jgi:hypothetical protein
MKKRKDTHCAPIIKALPRRTFNHIEIPRPTGVRQGEQRASARKSKRRS